MAQGLVPSDVTPDFESRRQWATESLAECRNSFDKLSSNDLRTVEACCVTAREGWASVLQHYLYDNEVAAPKVRELSSILIGFRDNIYPQSQDFVGSAPEPGRSRTLGFFHSIAFRAELIGCLLDHRVVGLYEKLRRELEDQFGLCRVVSTECNEDSSPDDSCLSPRLRLLKSAHDNLRIELANYSLELAREKGPYPQGKKQQFEIGKRLVSNVELFVAYQAERLGESDKESCSGMIAFSNHLEYLRSNILAELEDLSGSEERIATKFLRLGRTACEARSFLHTPAAGSNDFVDVPPTASGAIPVQLAKIEGAGPIPAEDPWAH